MLLTIRTTHTPATDLGYLLFKHPERVQHFELSFGSAHVFYPEVSEEACTAALLLDIDPVALVRGRGGVARGGSMDQYVNDRPYVASSFLSVAIAQTLGTALSGRSRERPELAATPIPLEMRIATLPCRGGERSCARFSSRWIRSGSRAAPAGPEEPEVGCEPLLHRHAARYAPAGGRALAPLRTGPRAGRRKALLGGRR